jgi:hypothetical protein
MADNTVIPAGTGGDTIRDIDRAGAGIKTQVVQLDMGGGNANAEMLVVGTAKGTQATNQLPVQQPKDAGRNLSTLFMAAPVATTTTETLQSLTGYKGGAAVTATTTPAVVTTGKTFRAQALVITYVATATTEGSVRVNLRANTAGVVAIGSPLVFSTTVGHQGGAEIVGAASTVTIPLPDGMEFAAGTGIGLTAQGFVGTTATASGSVQASLIGYEY